MVLDLQREEKGKSLAVQSPALPWTQTTILFQKLTLLFASFILYIIYIKNELIFK